MRKQYHFQSSDRGLLAWDVHRLVELTKDFPVISVSLSEIRELDEPFWFGDKNSATCRKIAQHTQLINETELKHPIILSQNGRVMDGMHRVCKALILGNISIHAVRFEQDPEPDFVGIDPDELPY